MKKNKFIASFLFCNILISNFGSVTVFAENKNDQDQALISPSTSDSKQEEPVTPSTSDSKQEEPVTPSTSDSKQEEPVTPSTSDSKQEEPVTPSTSDSKQEEPVTPSTSDSKQEEPATPSTSESKQEEPEYVPDLPSAYDSDLINSNYQLSKNVLRWKGLVEKEAGKQNASDYVPLLLALIQVETGGAGTKDIMQSSESAGHGMNYFQSEEESVRQGITHLMSIVNKLKSYNKGYEKNFKLIAQSYNFGSAFAKYVGDRGGNYDLTVSEDYSRTIVAPSLGNQKATKYSYVNAISLNLKKSYLYLNGGNFMYGEIVAQYLGIDVLEDIVGKQVNNGECYGLSAFYVEKLGGLKMMGSGKINAWSIGTDYNWEAYGWKVILNPTFEDLQSGDVIQWQAGGVLAPGIYGHTGVISTIGANGEFITYEQNGGKGQIVEKYKRNFSMNPIVSVVRKVNPDSNDIEQVNTISVTPKDEPANVEMYTVDRINY